MSGRAAKVHFCPPGTDLYPQIDLREVVVGFEGMEEDFEGGSEFYWEPVELVYWNVNQALSANQWNWIYIYGGY